jgi:hypothetical protein
MAMDLKYRLMRILVGESIGKGRTGPNFKLISETLDRIGDSAEETRADLISKLIKDLKNQNTPKLPGMEKE